MTTPDAGPSIDLATALRDWLRAGPDTAGGLVDLTDRAGYGADIYWPRIPGGEVPMPKRAVAFRVAGGTQSRSLRTGRARVEFRCYGQDEEEAERVQRALYDRLHGARNLRIPQGDGLAGILGAWRDVPGQPQQDPGTGWQYSYALYSITYALTPLAG